MTQFFGSTAIYLSSRTIPSQIYLSTLLGTISDIDNGQSFKILLQRVAFFLLPKNLFLCSGALSIPWIILEQVSTSLAIIRVNLLSKGLVLYDFNVYFRAQPCIWYILALSVSSLQMEDVAMNGADPFFAVAMIMLYFCFFFKSALKLK